MAVTDFFAGEIATELLRMLIQIVSKSCLCKSTAEQLISTIEQLLPIIREIKYSGVELPPFRQSQLDRLSETLTAGIELSHKVLASARWNVYKNLQLARKMEKLEKTVTRFMNGTIQAHVLADVHHLRYETAERFDRLDGAAARLEQRLGEMTIGAGGGGIGWVAEAVRMREEEESWEGGLGSIRIGLDLGKRTVKEMVMGREDLGVVGIRGIGGSGKTTLAREICRDEQVRNYFNNRILFLTVSQSPNLDQLKATIWGYVTGSNAVGSNNPIPNWNLQFEWRIQAKTLIILDDVWSLPVLEQLIFSIPGCKTLVVSRFRFPTVLKLTYEVELLKEEEAMSLFCHSAFAQKSIPLSANEKLIRQVVKECKGLPLALKVIGASLRDQSERFWLIAKNRLTRGEPICESHETKLLERMAISVDYLPKKVRECFMDLGAFPEDQKIPLDVLINMWVQIHDLEELDAFAILVELSNKNLLTLVKDGRDGDMYSSCYDISVTQHDVLRDLALHLSNRGNINERINDSKRLIMPRRESELPKEWERNADHPFNAQIVSIHTGEMREMEWFRIDFPKAEVLILNFSSKEYFLPPFAATMPNLRALIVINYSTSNANLHNLSVFDSLDNLRSLWLEKVSIPQLSISTIALKKLRKISLVLCKISGNLVESDVDLPRIFPSLLDLTIDHCDDLVRAPSICSMQTVETLSITNCHNLQELPASMGEMKALRILRLYACPSLKTLPHSICELVQLQCIDISQCVNLMCLPKGIGRLQSLEKIDMRECLQITSLPKSARSLQSLRLVVCDEEVSWLWKDMQKLMPDLHVQVEEKCFNLDWLCE